MLQQSFVYSIPLHISTLSCYRQEVTTNALLSYFDDDMKVSKHVAV
jgi:hypothetical protein